MFNLKEKIHQEGSNLVPLLINFLYTNSNTAEVGWSDVAIFENGHYATVQVYLYESISRKSATFERSAKFSNLQILYLHFTSTFSKGLAPQK